MDSPGTHVEPTQTELKTDPYRAAQRPREDILCIVTMTSDLDLTLSDAKKKQLCAKCKEKFLKRPTTSVTVYATGIVFDKVFVSSQNITN